MLEHLARVAADLRAPLLQDRPYLALRAAVGSGRAVGEKPENRVVGMLKLIYQSEYPTSQRYRLKVGIEGDPVGLFGGRARAGIAASANLASRGALDEDLAQSLRPDEQLTGAAGVRVSTR